MGRTPTLDEVRDAIMVQDLYEKLWDLRERRRQKIEAMGFSKQAVRERDGVVAAYLEDKSRRFHGVDPDATDRKSGRKKRRKNAKATVASGRDWAIWDH